MSEYQYYEFLALDRPLDKAAREALRDISSRANITATSFSNEYSYGDFRGDPDALMREWFDVHVYLANWGSRRLMIRVPETLIEEGLLKTCLQQSESAHATSSNGNLILDIQRGELESEWIDGADGWMASLAPLRADLLGGDARLLYLIWLMSVEYETIDADVTEPLPGIGPLTGPLEAFAAFFQIDSDLIAAAAERAGATPCEPVSADAVRASIAALPEAMKLDFLMRLHDGDLHVGAELRAAARRPMTPSSAPPSPPPRTAGEIRARAEAIHLAREAEKARQQAEAREQRAREAEQKRRETLLALARRGDGAWRDVEAEIERGNGAAYNRAADLLSDLKAVAEERDTLTEFSRKIVTIRERHGRKTRFLQRIAGLG